MPAGTQPQGLPPRPVVALVLRRSEQRTAEQRASLKQLCAEDPTITAAVDLAGDVLATLQKDLAAVQAGLTLRHSNGQTGGQAGEDRLGDGDEECPTGDGERMPQHATHQDNLAGVKAKRAPPFVAR